MRCGFRLLVILAVTTCASFEAFAVAGPSGNWSAGQYRPTGDALFDRYALAVLQCPVEQLVAGDGPTHPLTLPQTLLASWEQEFGHDPRYWQLRYFCRKNRYENPYGFVDADPSSICDVEVPDAREPLDYLLEARRRRIADWETLCLIEQHNPCSYSLLPEDANPYSESGERRWSGHGSMTEQHQIIAYNAALETEQLALLDAAVAADARQAWPYYQRANYWLSLGEEQRARDDLQRGNAAPLAAVPHAFPISHALDTLESSLSAAEISEWSTDEIAPANLLVYGGLIELMLLDGQNFSRLLQWKERAKEAELFVSLGAVLDNHDALKHAFIRMGTSRRAGRLEAMVMGVNVWILANGLIRNGEDTFDFPTQLVDHWQSTQRVQELEAGRVQEAAEKWPQLLTLGTLLKADLGAFDMLTVGMPSFWALHRGYGTPEFEVNLERMRNSLHRWELVAQWYVEDLELTRDGYWPLLQQQVEFSYSAL